MVMMFFTTATTAVFFMMMVVMFVAATTTTATRVFMMVMMMLTTAATAGTFIMVMIVPTAATTTARTFVVMMVTATATTTATTAASVTLDANRFKRFFNFGHFKTNHAEHLGDIGKRKHGKTFRGFSHFNATVNQSADSFLHGAKVTLHVKHLFNGWTNHPELTSVVNKDVVNHQGALFFNGHSNRAFSRFKSITPGHTFFRRNHELLSAFK